MRVKKKQPVVMQGLVTLAKVDVQHFLDLHANWNFALLGKRNYIVISDKRWAINMDSERYKVFSNSTKCASCNMRGEFFLLQCHPAYIKNSSAHMNLYGLDSWGKEVLFTKDHIIPRSKGGKDHISNYQTMCEVCNKAKSDNFIGPFQAKESP